MPQDYLWPGPSGALSLGEYISDCRRAIAAAKFPAVTPISCVAQEIPAFPLRIATRYSDPFSAALAAAVSGGAPTGKDAAVYGWMFVRELAARHLIPGLHWTSDAADAPLVRSLIDGLMAHFPDAIRVRECIEEIASPSSAPILKSVMEFFSGRRGRLGAGIPDLDLLAIVCPRAFGADPFRGAASSAAGNWISGHGDCSLSEAELPPALTRGALSWLCSTSSGQVVRMPDTFMLSVRRGVIQSGTSRNVVHLRAAGVVVAADLAASLGIPVWQAALAIERMSVRSYDAGQVKHSLIFGDLFI